MKKVELALTFVIAIGLTFSALAPKIAHAHPQEEWIVYSTIQSNVTPEYVVQLAGVFNITADVGDVEWRDHFGVVEYYVNISWPRVLEVTNVSGAIWYRDYSKLLNSSYEPASLPSFNEARVIAENFILNNFLYFNATTASYYFLDIGNMTTTTFDPELNQTSRVTNCMEVHFGFNTSEGYRARGPGAKMTVVLGDNGGIIGFQRVWRELEVYGNYTAISQSEANQTFIEHLGVEPEQLNVQWGYWCEPGFLVQDFVQPMWLFEASIMVEGDLINHTKNLPATNFSPMVNITSPADKSHFDPSEEITFSASVGNGTPPYTYVWQSSVDGILYEGPDSSFTTTLSVAKKKEVVVPHGIMLRVTDANGIEASAQISVTISSPVGGVQVPIDKLQVLLEWLTQPFALISILIGATILLGLIVKKKGKIGFIGLILFAILISNGLLMGVHPVSAVNQNDDGNDREVGIEWVNNYENGAYEHSDENAKGFYDALEDDGWETSFDLGDDQAWEQDFKCRDCSGGGHDYEYIDTVDFAYFAGRGHAEYIKFISDDNDYENFEFHRAHWGGTGSGDSGEAADLEWIVIDANDALRDEYEDKYAHERWPYAFEGLHMILGFDSTRYDSEDRGKEFAYYLIEEGRKILDAWYEATTKTEESGSAGAAMWAEGEEDNQDPDNDHLPGHGYVSDDPYPVDSVVYTRWPC